MTTTISSKSEPNNTDSTQTNNAQTTVKISFKTLQQLKFSIDANLNWTVKELKDKIEQMHGKEFAENLQKIIYNGKILKDEDKLSTYNFDEKKFAVVMITRPPPPVDSTSSAGSTPQNSQSASKADSKHATPKRPTQQTSSTNKSNPSTQQQTASAQQTVPSSNIAPTSANTTTAVANNTTTANSGSVANTVTSQDSGTNTSAATTTTTTTSTNNQPTSQQQNQTTIESANRDTASPEFSLVDSYDILTSQPQFRQLQHLVQQNPHLLSSTIEALAESNPDLYQFISDHPEAFVSALHQPITDRQQRSQARQARNQGASELVINITQQDKEAIDRLKELGFSEDMAAQAYLACNKDEQLAANLLFQMDQ